MSSIDYYNLAHVYFPQDLRIRTVSVIVHLLIICKCLLNTYYYELIYSWLGS